MVKYLNLGVFFIPAVFIILLGTVNELIYGWIDGLASCYGIDRKIFTVAAIGMGHNDLAAESGLVSCATVGSLLGFLVFNVYPARECLWEIQARLCTWGFVAATALMLRLSLFIPIVALIYMIEVLSVMAQVLYFKMTKGKRLFKMAPIHHHFELSGWPETKVVAIFAITTAVCCLIGLVAI